jgi:hypothetical protein
MNRRSRLLLGLGFAALLAHPALAQDNPTPPPATNPPSAGGGNAPTPGSTPGARSAAKDAAAEARKYDAHIQFDKDSAKGEILCKGGKEEGGGIEYERCAKDKLEKYDEIAVKKGVVASKGKYDTLTPEQKDSAKKVAFYDSAREEVKQKMNEVLQSKKEDSIEYKKYRGMLRQINKEYRHALSKCQRYADSMKCPAPPAANEPGATDSARPGPAAGPNAPEPARRR